MGRSTIDLALSCYPKWWTERYGEEMRAVIDDLKSEGRSETSIATGLARDALRTRLQARGMPRTYGLLANRTTNSVAAGTLPWLVIVPFVLLVIGRFNLHSSAGYVERGYPFQFTLFRTRVVSQPGFHWVHPSISTASWIVGASTMVMDGLYVLTFFVLATGLSALREGIAREKSRNRRSMSVVTWVPFYTLLGIVALYLAQWVFNEHRHPGRAPNSWVGGHPALAALMGNLMWTVAIGGWLTAIVGLIFVSNRVNLPPGTLRFGRTVSVLTSFSLSLTFVIFVIWAIAVDVQNRQQHAAGSIVASYPRHFLWLPMALALGIASVISIYGATNARRSWRTIYAHRLWDT